MPISQRALELENRHIVENGEPTLAAAHEILKEDWRHGDRDHELGLHLMFLSWYGIIEPGHMMGFVENPALTQELNQTFSQVHTYFEPQIYQDAEALYAFGLATRMFWFMFDDPSLWEQRAEEYQQLYRSLEPNGINPEIFRNRGAYGDYYSGQAKVRDGY